MSARTGQEGGADEGLEAWMLRYGPGLKRYFQKRVSSAEADELVQDVFLAMHQRGAAAPVDNVQGYLFTIAAHLLSRRRQIVTSALDDEAGRIAESLSPERILISRQEITRVLVAIKKLPPRTRQAFVLHRFENMTYSAIARQLGISVSAVSKLVARALALIAEDTGAAP
jgi:RNA polymerase sigma factor (sigma-70 family)